jgi:hypothetical protein
MIRYHTITIDDYLIPEGYDLPDSIDVEIWANATYETVDMEVGNSGGWNVGEILWKGNYKAMEEFIIDAYILEHEDRLKEILASK